MNYFLSAFVCISICACSGESEEQLAAEGYQLPDSLFAFQNIENTLFTENMFWDTNDWTKVYVDSTAKKEFIKLDSAQKMRLLAPITGIDSNYLVEYMDAFFVSKQKMIGAFTPITIFMYGDDYSALHYILLDKTMKPVSSYIVNGGEAGGPVAETENSITLPPVIHSFFKGDVFYNYSLTETMNTDSVDQPSTFDSLYFEHHILPEGKIQTKRLDSVRFERMPN